MAHEDDLLNNRTVWLLTSQAFLLVGYVIMDKTKLPPTRLDYHLAFEILGMLSTITIFSAILAAEMVFVELRNDIYSLSACPDLTMRELPHVGIGSGLLAPILLAILFLFTWAVFFFRGWGAAALLASSGACFSFFVVGRAHRFTSHSGASLIVDAALVIAILLLIVAVAVGISSIRRSPRPCAPQLHATRQRQ